MIQSIQKTCNDGRDGGFARITETAASRLGAARTAQFENALRDLSAAASWESMALRSVARSQPRRSVPAA